MMSRYSNCLSSITNRYQEPCLGVNLILDLPCTSIYQDPNTGEVKPASDITDKIKLRVNQEKDPVTENTQGSDRDRVYVEGYLVEPKKTAFDTGDRLDGEFLYEGCWVKCSFHPVTKLASVFTENNDLHSHTGRKIAGYLKLERVT